MLSRRALVALAFAGCANAGVKGQPGDDAPPIDAPSTVTDASLADAPCISATTEVLINGNFDGALGGAGWHETPFQAGVQLITTDDGIVEDTPTRKAWLGGYPSTANDSMYEDITIPPGTSMLQFTGKYDVATTETGTTVHDVASIKLETPAGQVLDTISSLDNAHPTATWTPIDHAIPAAGLSGQTVRLIVRSQLDSVNNTNFFLDTLSLQATHCP